MTKKQFENKYAGKAVHCDTEEKAKEFLTLALKYGWSVFGNEEIIEITYWDKYKEKTCYRLEYAETIGYCNLIFYKSMGWEVVEFESEENKVKKTEKVFDLGLFVEWAIENGRSQEKILASIKSWALKSHGKTEEEMGKNVIYLADECMKEVEVEYELSEKEIEILKALKVLDYSWISSDQDGVLYAYEVKPIKSNKYYDGGDYIMLKPNLFNFISWKDEEPTSIEELLKYA